MTIHSVVNIYRELVLEIELLKFKVNYLKKEMSLMIASIDKERSLNLIAEHESLCRTIEELEKMKLEYKLLLTAFIAQFNDKDILIFVECILCNKSCEEVSKKYMLENDFVQKKYNEIKNLIEKEIEE